MGTLMQQSRHAAIEGNAAMQPPANAPALQAGVQEAPALPAMMQVPAQSFLQTKTGNQWVQCEEEVPAAPAAASSEPDFLGLRKPFFNRSVPHLYDADSALGVWQYNLQFFRRFGLDDKIAGKAANFTAPLFIDAQLKADNPTWWEVTDQQLQTSSFMAAAPLFHFDANFRNWQILPFLSQ